MSSNGCSKISHESNTNSQSDEQCSLADLESHIKKEIDPDELIENNFTLAPNDADINHVKKEAAEGRNGRLVKVKAEQRRIKEEVKFEPIKDEIKEESSDSSDDEEEEDDEGETSSDSGDDDFVVSFQARRRINPYCLGYGS